MRAETFEKLAKEFQGEQERIAFAIKAIQQENRETIANLDAALQVIAEIGERYSRQDAARQCDILRQVVDLHGKVLRLELKSPFIYLHHLAGGEGGRNWTKKKSKSNPRSGKQTSSPNGTGCSLHLGLGDPTPIQNERTAPSNISNYIQYLEITRYPQRIALEQLLIDERNN